jgi:hypothetical protein
MNQKLLTPFLFSQLKTDREKSDAYNNLWDAYQVKKKRKSLINNQLEGIYEQRRRGNRVSNKADQVISDKIIEHYWKLQQASEPVTAEILFNKQHDTFRPNHFVIGSVTRWNTSLRKVWFRESWENTDSEFARFKVEAWAVHRTRIGSRQRQR